MITIIQFLNNILGISGKYEFILYIIAGLFALIILDGIITFLFSSISSLTTRR